MEQVISSSILILAIMFIRKVFQKSVSKRIIYAMWLIVAIRLLFPLQLDNSFHILNIMSWSQARLFMKTAAVEQKNLEEKHIENEQNVQKTQSELMIQNPSAAKKVLDEQEQSKVQDSSNAKEFSIVQSIEVRQADWRRILHYVWIVGIMIIFGCLICSNFVFYKRIRKNRRFYQSFENRVKVYETDSLV